MQVHQLCESLHISEDEKSQFKREGYIGPCDFLDKKTLEVLFRRCHANLPNALLANPLARHIAVRKMVDLASHPVFMRKLAALVGNDILLWGSQIIKQQPGKKKRFHVDAEYSAISGPAIWLAVKNVVPQNTFFVITKSHLINRSPQELQKLQGINLEDADEVLVAARQFDPECELVKVDIRDGQFIIFDGKLWHGAANNTNEARLAMNFRYTTPDQFVRISKDGELPDVQWLEKRPYCVTVAGQDRYQVNKTIDKRKISYVRSFLKGCLYYLPKHTLQKSFKKLKKFTSA